MDTVDQLFPDNAYISNADFIPWDSLRDRTVFITGATGLIGYTLVHALAYADMVRGLGLRVIALVRDVERARKRFASLAGSSSLVFVAGTVEDLPHIDAPIDYIIHGASQTASRSFVEQPVETIKTALQGTAQLLELARQKRVSAMVYLSSMEVYGYPPRGHKVKENEIGMLSPLEVRNSYPISKMQSESLCFSYAKEYKVPAKVVRLTQTFGPGVSYNDPRVFAEFARCAIEKRDIVLKTRGETERSYLYTADAAAAILTVLLKGEPGRAYNAANEGTYCSIADMAKMVAEASGIGIRFELQDESVSGYQKTLYMDLDTTALSELGWHPGAANGGMTEMYARLERYMKDHH